MIAPRDGRAVLLSQTTNSFRSHQQIILFFSQRTRVPCGMTHNVWRNTAGPTHHISNISLPGGAEAWSGMDLTKLSAGVTPVMRVCRGAMLSLSARIVDSTSIPSGQLLYTLQLHQFQKLLSFSWHRLGAPRHRA